MLSMMSNLLSMCQFLEKWFLMHLEHNDMEVLIVLDM